MNTTATHLFGGALFCAGLTYGEANESADDHFRTKRGLRGIAAALVATASLVTAPASFADIIHVPNDFPTIQGAIDASVDGDDIVVAAGEYVESIDFLGKTITCRSIHGADVTSIVGNGADDVVRGAGDGTTLMGFTVTGGGNGVEAGAYMVLVGCTIANNAGNGAFIHNDCSVFIDCTITANGDDGVLSYSNACSILIGCTVTANADEGLFHGYHSGSLVFNSTISDNGGWGIAAGYAASVQIWNSAITGNDAGGFAYSEQGDRIHSCTIAGNGGWGIVGSSYNRLDNCVVWGNSLGAIQNLEAEVVRYSDIEGGFAGEGNIDADPLFVDPENGDFRLSPGSPCIDAGDNKGWGFCDLDLDGRFRRFDDPNTRDTGLGDPPIIDMGAYEFGSPLGDDCNGNGMDDDCEVAEGITPDCNGNGVPDDCDIADGFSSDCNGNGVPDECDKLIDCNDNGVLDACDIADGTSLDCNGNGVPDECDAFEDCNDNGIPDECEEDCNDNGVPDECDIADGTSLDVNSNGIPDECEADCNANGVPDDVDIADGISEDCNVNGVPDECEEIADPFPGYAVAFEDTVHRVVMPRFSGFPAAEITVSFWLNTADDRQAGIVSYAVVGENNEFLIFDANNLCLSIHGAFLASSVSVADGAWHHVAVTWQEGDGSFTIYVDGLRVFEGNLGQGQPLGSQGTMVLGDEQDCVGGCYDPNQAFIGVMDELRVWEVVRSQEEIQANMFQQLTGDEPGLVGYWRFDEGEGDVAGDLAGENNGELQNDLPWLQTFRCDADLDCDQVVGTTDLILLLGAWGTDPGGPPDFDGDGNVGTSDLIELLGAWGPCE